MICSAPERNKPVESLNARTFHISIRAFQNQPEKWNVIRVFSNLTLGWIVQVSAHKLWAAGARSLQVGKHKPPSRMEELCR